jgi:hypothetical protein
MELCPLLCPFQMFWRQSLTPSHCLLHTRIGVGMLGSAQAHSTCEKYTRSQIAQRNQLLTPAVLVIVISNSLFFFTQEHIAI